MRGQTGEQCFGSLALEPVLQEKVGRWQPLHSKLGQQERMPWDSWHRTKDLGGKIRPLLYIRFHEALPSRAICSQAAGRIVEISLESDSRSIVERMRQRSRRVNPFETEITQRQRREEWGAGRHGVH